MFSMLDSTTVTNWRHDIIEAAQRGDVGERLLVAGGTVATARAVFPQVFPALVV